MQSKKVYIAPDGFLAFIDRAHEKHVHASAFFRYFAQEHYQLYTSIVTVDETYNELCKTISPSLGKDFLKALSLSSLNMLYPETADMKAALKTVITGNSSELTFGKALMAIMCSKRNISQICTFEYFQSLFGLQLFYLPI